MMPARWRRAGLAALLSCAVATGAAAQQPPRQPAPAAPKTPAAPKAAAAAKAPATWHAETLSSGPQGVHVTQYWSKGSDRLRAETVIAGHRLVTLVNGPLYYAVDFTAGQAVAIKRSKRALAEDRTRSRLLGLEGFVIKARGGEKVATENLAGRKCDVWRLTDDRGRRAVWVQQEPAKEMLPLRVEIYNRQAGAEIRTDYIQWATGLELPDRLFLPDPGFTLTTLEYEEYVKRSSEGEALVPVLHANLLHGEK